MGGLFTLAVYVLGDIMVGLQIGLLMLLSIEFLYLNTNSEFDHSNKFHCVAVLGLLPSINHLIKAQNT
jgi:hypothetical protein